MKLTGNCQTTAMGIMPHTDIERALELSLSLDIPFWPQLPRYSFYEDMYVQISEHFPGIIVDFEKQRISFSLEKFYGELDHLLNNWDNDDFFRLSPEYSVLFHRFLEMDLSPYQYVRGQNIGPVSLGLKILDENKKSMIYHEEVKGIIFDFVARKTEVQLKDMLEKHPGSFVWVDEPGLEMIFKAFTGYASDRAQRDYRSFLENFPGPKGVHLCGNPDWSFLLQLDLDILSADVFTWGHIFSRYKEDVKDFLDRGGIISWGITPTLTEEYEKENVKSMIEKLEEMWVYLENTGVPREQILSQAWLAPSRCCLVNPDGELTVEKSYRMLKEVSEHFKAQL